MSVVYTGCILHTVGHALPKAHLFMLVGLLLHVSGRQDSRVLPSGGGTTYGIHLYGVYIHMDMV